MEAFPYSRCRCFPVASGAEWSQRRKVHKGKEPFNLSCKTACAHDISVLGCLPQLFPILARKQVRPFLWLFFLTDQTNSSHLSNVDLGGWHCHSWSCCHEQTMAQRSCVCSQRGSVVPGLCGHQVAPSSVGHKSC